MVNLRQQIVNIAKKSAHTSDVCCRYGGEEFAVIFPTPAQRA
ncbi:MAG: diguanylate cyclase [Desulfuromonadales bacterium]|nr:diguanylate cyclase [Desulfuromonadales bacterium]